MKASHGSTEDLEGHVQGNLNVNTESEDDSDCSEATIGPTITESSPDNLRSWEANFALQPPTESYPDGRRCRSAVPWARVEKHWTSLYDISSRPHHPQSSEGSADSKVPAENPDETCFYDSIKQTVTQIWPITADVESFVQNVKMTHSAGLPVAEIADWGRSLRSNTTFITAKCPDMNESFNLNYLRRTEGDLVLDAVRPQVIKTIEQLRRIGIHHSRLLPEFIYVDRFLNVLEIRGWEYFSSTGDFPLMNSYRRIVLCLEHASIESRYELDIALMYRSLHSRSTTDSSTTSLASDSDCAHSSQPWRDIVTRTNNRLVLLCGSKGKLPICLDNVLLMRQT